MFDDSLAGEEIAIFGHTGLIGIELVKYLVANKARVTTFGRKSLGFDVKHRFIDLDIELSRDFSLDTFSKVIYLAQSRNFKDFPLGLSSMFFVNTLNPFKLAELSSISGAKFIYASTGSVYDLNQPGRQEDNSENLSRRSDQYVFSKLQAELLIQGVMANSIIIRPFTVFGRGARGESLIANLIRRIHLGEFIEIPSIGETILTPTPVETIVSAIVHLIRVDVAGIYNIAGNQEMTLSKLVNVLGQALNSKPIIKLSPSLSALNLKGNIDKLLLTGFDNFIPFEESIAEML